MQGRVAVTSLGNSEEKIRCKWGLRTFCNACDSFVLVAIRLLEGKENIGLGPIGEHLADYGCFIAILLSELGELAFVFERTEVFVLVV